MERKYRSQKKAIVWLIAAIAIVAALIIWGQISIGSAKENAQVKWAEEIANLEAERDEIVAEFEAGGYEATEDALKEEAKELKALHKEYVKTWEDGGDISMVGATPEPTAEPTPEPTEEPTAEPTEEPVEEATEEPAE